MAMRLMGEQFVTGKPFPKRWRTPNAKLEDKGFRYSYDMLGGLALTAADAQAYMVSYQQAIHAIGKPLSAEYEGLRAFRSTFCPAPALAPRAV